MYEKFYGLNEKPFNIVPNPAYLYRSEKHQDALTYLEYGLMEATGFILLTGEIGTGKTTLVRYILNQVEPDMDVAVIFNTNITSDQLIGLILDNFGINSKKDKTANLDLLYRFLIEKFSDGSRVLIIIDEAQNLAADVLEEVRMLSNLQSDEQILLQIMLVGQPELKARLQDPRLAQLAQRITVNYHLSTLTREETGEYIAYRLKKAGGSPDIFMPEAVDLIYTNSGGVPRIINLFCDTAMVYGFGYELKQINSKVIDRVIEDKGGIGFYVEPEKKKDEDKKDEDKGGILPAMKGEGGDEELLQRFQRFEVNLQDIRLKINMLVKKQANQDDYHDEMVSTLQNLLDRERENSDKIIKEYAALDERFKRLSGDYFGMIKKEAGEERPTLQSPKDEDPKNQHVKRGIMQWFAKRY
ncbi:general secretion pathway protein A [Desulfosarcina sp. BuS5]|uniref:AAA family ATPase n=1 Tax=Desulfosarcina sp. BuS5 TaxID=933262 RepID=UPI000684DD3B|nr:AAA family ATPase [Desulfosarcina sp. BuS5]WDN89449.1 general secretion pathway protein A [Desulfosarcina sp. BuS5]